MSRREELDFAIEGLLLPLTGMADSDEETDRFSALDAGDRKGRVELLRERLEPEFMSHSEDERVHLREMLREALATPAYDSDDLLGSLLLPVEITNGRDFLQEVWEALFPENPGTPEDL